MKDKKDIHQFPLLYMWQIQYLYNEVQSHFRFKFENNISELQSQLKSTIDGLDDKELCYSWTQWKD